MTDRIRFDDRADGRHDRQMAIPWWDQALLARSRVVVVGAGALGNELLKLLALLGVGRMLVVDFDTVAASNLSRTVLFRDGDVGLPKAALAAERAGAIDPGIVVRAVAGDIGRDLGLAALRAADVVLGGVDSVNARWAINRRCRLAGVPWIDAGISATQGQVTRYLPDRGACYECTFTAATAARFNARFSCTGLARRVPDTAVPTTAVVASLVAALAVDDAVRLLHDPTGGMGLPAGHRLSALLDARRQFEDELPVDPGCAAHADPPVPAGRLREGASGLTPASLAAAAGLPNGTVDLGFDLVETFACDRCGAVDPVCRPAALVFDDESACPACGAERVPAIGSAVSASSPGWERPLAALGVADRDALRVAGDGSERWIELGGIDPWTGVPAPETGADGPPATTMEGVPG